MFEDGGVQPRVDVPFEARRYYDALPAAVRLALRYPEEDPGEQLTVWVVGQEFARLGKWYEAGDARPRTKRACAAKLTAARLASLLIETGDWALGWTAYRKGAFSHSHPAVQLASRELRLRRDATSQEWELAQLRRSGPAGLKLTELCRELSKEEGGRLALYVSGYGEPHFIALTQKVDALGRAIAATGPRHWRMEAATYVRGVVELFKELMGPAMAEAKARDRALIEFSRLDRRAS